jgi:CO dehydrogenase maturation factor
MKIALSGKGGSGKTTISATLARLFARRGISVLAIDGDPNPNLGVALGVAAPGLAGLEPVPRTILEEQATDSGTTRLALTQPIEIIASDYGVPAPDGIRLLLSGRVDHAGAG